MLSGGICCEILIQETSLERLIFYCHHDKKDEPPRVPYIAVNKLDSKNVQFVMEY
jgi:hypothetical protein